MIGDRLSAMRLYRAMPGDRAVINLWMTQTIGEETMNRTLAVTLIDGGVRLEMMAVDDDGRITLDERGELAREFVDVECELPPPAEWGRCMAAPLLFTELDDNDADEDEP